MDSSAVAAELREFVVREFLQGDGRGLDENSQLLELGIIESLKLISLLNFIEERFAVQVPDDALSPQNFGSLAAISQLVTGLQAGARG